MSDLERAMQDVMEGGDRVFTVEDWKRSREILSAATVSREGVELMTETIVVDFVTQCGWCDAWIDGTPRTRHAPGCAATRDRLSRQSDSSTSRTKVDGSASLPEVAGVAKRLDIRGGVSAALKQRANMVRNQTDIVTLAPQTAAIFVLDCAPLFLSEIASRFSRLAIPFWSGWRRWRAVASIAPLTRGGGVCSFTISGIAPSRHDQADVSPIEQAINSGFSSSGSHPFADELIDHLEASTNGVGPILDSHGSQTSRGDARSESQALASLNCTTTGAQMTERSRNDAPPVGQD